MAGRAACRSTIGGDTRESSPPRLRPLGRGSRAPALAQVGQAGALEQVMLEAALVDAVRPTRRVVHVHAGEDC